MTVRTFRSVPEREAAGRPAGRWPADRRLGRTNESARLARVQDSFDDNEAMRRVTRQFQRCALAAKATRREDLEGTVSGPPQMRRCSSAASCHLGGNEKGTWSPNVERGELRTVCGGQIQQVGVGRARCRGTPIRELASGLVVSE